MSTNELQISKSPPKEKQYKTIGYQIHELFMYLDQYLNNDEYHELLIQDYLSLFKVKPKKLPKRSITENCLLKIDIMLLLL